MKKLLISIIALLVIDGCGKEDKKAHEKDIGTISFMDSSGDVVLCVQYYLCENGNRVLHGRLAKKFAYPPNQKNLVEIYEQGRLVRSFSEHSNIDPVDAFQDENEREKANAPLPPVIENIQTLPNNILDKLK